MSDAAFALRAAEKALEDAQAEFPSMPQATVALYRERRVSEALALCRSTLAALEGEGEARAVKCPNPEKSKP